jgi:hypothetical protein
MIFEVALFLSGMYGLAIRERDNEEKTKLCALILIYSVLYTRLYGLFKVSSVGFMIDCEKRLKTESAHPFYLVSKQQNRLKFLSGYDM